MSRWGALAAIALAACSPGRLPEPPPQPDAAQARAYDATIVLMDPELEGMVCAGEYIAPTLIATAKHCTDAVEADVGGSVFFLTMRNISEENIEPSVGVVRAVDGMHDLAVIETREKNTFVDIWPAPAAGSVVHSLGHPAADLYTQADGLLLFTANGYHMVGISIYHGSSGGGLYDEKWRLIGVASSMISGGQIGKFFDAQALIALCK